MEIIEEFEKTCLTLERKGKKKEAETLRHDVTNTLLKAKPPPSNLTSQQKKGLSYLKKNKENIAVVPFDKGQGFVTIEREKLVEKSEKEFQNVTLDTRDTTNSLQTKIQTKLRDLHNKNKIDTATYKKIYPSTSITPTATPVIKAHKPQKDHPARLITSCVQSPQQNVASHLDGVLETFVEGNKLTCKNSFEFVQDIKKVKVGPNEKMVWG